jgi:hypothetical protein
MKCVHFYCTRMDSMLHFMSKDLKHYVEQHLCTCIYMYIHVHLH